MKLYISQITLSAILLITQSCSSQSNLKETTKNEASNSQVSEAKSISQSSSKNEKNQTNAVVSKSKFIVPEKITSTQAVPIVIDIQDKAGKSINRFDSLQEKSMHLIVVSDDLRFFQHVYPRYKDNGRFEINPDFPAPGNYTVFSNYKPTGQNEQVAIQKITIPGEVPIPKDLEKFSNVKILDGIKVTSNFAESNLKSGKEVKLSFDLQSINSQKTVKNLQPYLGEKASLVIVRSSSPLTQNDYISPQILKDSNNNKIQFLTNFPQPGTYKLWLQFNQGGKLNIADFWINVK